MTEVTEIEYASYRKKVWIIYSVLAVLIATIFVVFVARDAEERFFYPLMIIAGSYVLRPMDRVIDKYVTKIFGVTRPKQVDTEDSNKES